MMLMPRVMKGLEKSMTFSRSAVMVRPATARSAFCINMQRRRDRKEEEGEHWKLRILRGLTLYLKRDVNTCSAVCLSHKSTLSYKDTRYK